MDQIHRQQVVETGGGGSKMGAGLVDSDVLIASDCRYPGLLLSLSCVCVYGNTLLLLYLSWLQMISGNP